MIRADRMVAFVVAVVAIAVVAAVNLLVVVTPAAAGPVEVLLQARNVSAAANVEINGVTDSKSDSKSAPGAGPFNGLALAHATAGDADQTISGDATASQDSQLLGSRFSFAGHLTAGGSLSGLDGVNSFDFDASTATDALVNFRLDERMTLTPTVNVNDNFEATKDNSSFVLEVTRLGGEIVADFRNVFPVDLDAGDYTLSFNYAFGPSNSSDFESKESDYDIAIDFASADGGGGGGAIPLPPGLLLGCAGLALAEVVRRSRGSVKLC